MCQCEVCGQNTTFSKHLQPLLVVWETMNLPFQTAWWCKGGKLIVINVACFFERIESVVCVGILMASKIMTSPVAESSLKSIQLTLGTPGKWIHCVLMFKRYFKCESNMEGGVGPVCFYFYHQGGLFWVPNTITWLKGKSSGLDPSLHTRWLEYLPKLLWAL